tara:strand:- start:779 stop:1078 length:300 start_codon:yes stop_codon:yes gene_type:complete
MEHEKNVEIDNGHLGANTPYASGAVSLLMSSVGPIVEIASDSLPEANVPLTNEEKISRVKSNTQLIIDGLGHDWISGTLSETQLSTLNNAVASGVAYYE